MSSAIAKASPSGLYRETRERLSDLISGLDAGELAAPVPACPGWTVSDVLAHLTATAEDAVAGRLSGVPTDEFTAGQVARLAGVPVAERLARWAEAAAQFEPAIDRFEIWPAVMDVASHEQDIRGAIGKPGARDCTAIVRCTPYLLTGFRLPVPLRVVTEDGEYLAGPRSAQDANDDGGAGNSAHQTGLTVSTTRFEAFRWRLGRRSREQMAELAWTGDHSAVIDHLTIFGPAIADLVE